MGDRGPQSEAFLVTRINGDWQEVHSLRVDGPMIIGRGSGNFISLHDEKCSRRHCDLRLTDDGWLLNDLGSSNGTLINGERNHGSALLQESDVLRIGSTELLFTTDPARVTAQASAEFEGLLDLPGEESVDEILERRRATGFLAEDDCWEVGRGGQKASLRCLFRLMNEMISATSVRELADTALKGLNRNCGADIGAVLLFTELSGDPTGPKTLQLVSYRAPKGVPYRKVSERLSRETLSTGEAVLGLNVKSDPSLKESQSLETMDASSVICAPIRSGEAVLGLIHLYSLGTERSFNADELEFTLAIADEVAPLLKSLQHRDELSESIGRVAGEAQALRWLLEVETEMVGDSEPMRTLASEVARVARTESTVLIRGESGVGKELVARAIHFGSPRREQPFVCLNCAALTESLLESELFGHERGAFTGATERKAGKFEQADRGTLFLDEVGEMSASTQAKFLRVLEGHSFERVGGQKSITVNVRVVAATNRDLEQAVRDGEFRKDLYFRLQVLELFVPPLRERVADIPVLANWFLERLADRGGRTPKALSRGAQLRLMQHSWPGNVRELRNVIERSAIMAAGREITDGDLKFSRGFEPVSAEVPLDSMEAAQSDAPPPPLMEMEKQHIYRTLIWTGWVKREAARLLGIERSTLDRKIQKFELQPPE